MCDLCELELAAAEQRRLDRRRFLAGTAAAAATLALPAAALADDSDQRIKRILQRDRAQPDPKAVAKRAAPSGRDQRELGFVNLHTGERVRVTYRANGDYLAGGLDRLDIVMRDVRNDDIKRMDPRVFDLLHDLKSHFESDEDYLLISGYRSPETNNWLRSLGRGVAKRSYHMRGMATDVRLPGVNVVEFAKAARDMKRGGVGLYRRSRFVHIDIARPRHWNF